MHSTGRKRGKTVSRVVGLEVDLSPRPTSSLKLNLLDLIKEDDIQVEVRTCLDSPTRLYVELLTMIADDAPKSLCSDVASQFETHFSRSSSFEVGVPQPTEKVSPSAISPERRTLIIFMAERRELA